MALGVSILSSKGRDPLEGSLCRALPSTRNGRTLVSANHPLPPCRSLQVLLFLDCQTPWKGQAHRARGQARRHPFTAATGILPGLLGPCSPGGAEGRAWQGRMVCRSTQPPTLPGLRPCAHLPTECPAGEPGRTEQRSRAGQRARKTERRQSPKPEEPTRQRRKPGHEPRRTPHPLTRPEGAPQARPRGGRRNPAEPRTEPLSGERGRAEPPPLPPAGPGPGRKGGPQAAACGPPGPCRPGPGPASGGRQPADNTGAARGTQPAKKAGPQACSRRTHRPGLFWLAVCDARAPEFLWRPAALPF